MTIWCNGPGGDHHGEHKPREMFTGEMLDPNQFECPECHTVVEITSGESE